jgi:DHA1 family bicyclomycin/chloramphenicol resistance-like MFS transporter
VLIYQSSLMAVAPILAPIIGAEILRLTSWQGTFVLLGVFGALLLLGSLLISEPSRKQSDKSLLQTFGNLKTLIRTPGFVSPLLLFALAGIPILMFIGSATDIYITGFGLSEQTFSMFFGFNAAVTVIGPFAYMLLAKRLSTQAIIGLAFLLTAVSGLWIFVSGDHSPIIFALAAIPGALGSSLNRPPSMHIMLEQGRQDTGAASSLMNFTFLTAGCIGMVFISLDWENRIWVYGLATLFCGLFSLVLWPKAWKKCDPAQLKIKNQAAHSASY